MTRRYTIAAPVWAWVLGGVLIAALVIGIFVTAARVQAVEAMAKELIETHAQDAITAANAEAAAAAEEPEEVEPAEEVEPSIDDTWRQTSIGEIKITHYCACEKCCGAYANGMTASGTVCTEGRTVACDFLPFGTLVNIGGNIYTVEDRIGEGSTDHIDVFVADHERALAAGVGRLECYVVTFGG